MKESIFLNRKQLRIIRCYLWIYNTLFEYGVFLLGLIVALISLFCFLNFDVFAFAKAADLSEINNTKKELLLTQKQYYSKSLFSGLNLISLGAINYATSGTLITQDTIMNFNDKIVFPRGAVINEEILSRIAVMGSGNHYQESDFFYFFQNVLLKPLGVVLPSVNWNKYGLTGSAQEFFGLACLEGASSRSFVCKESLENFLDYFPVLEYAQTNPSESFPVADYPQIEQSQSLSQQLAQVYPKVKYSDNYKQLFCEGVVSYLEFGGVVDTKVTEMMASCEADIYKKYTLLRQAAEIREGFKGGVSDARFYLDPYLNQYKLFSLQQLIYSQIRASSQTESVIGGYLDFWINLLKKENEREGQLLSSFSKQFSHWYHQKILIPYLRDESAKLTTEQKNILLSKLLQIESGDKNGLFKGISEKEENLTLSGDALVFDEVNLDTMFRANIPVQFVLISTDQIGDALKVLGEDQVTKLKFEAMLKYDGAKLYVDQVLIEQNTALAELLNTLLKADKVSFVGMLTMLKENLTIVEQNQKFQVDFCAVMRKELANEELNCTENLLVVEKNKTESNSGLVYRFSLRDKTLQSVQISDKLLQEQVLKELKLATINQDTTPSTIKKILNYEIKQEESGFGAKEQILVNDLFVKYFKQKPTKVKISGALIRIWFEIKEVKFIGSIDLATNRLSQISLDFGEKRPLGVIQRLEFDLKEQSRDKINAFLLDPVDYLRKLNPRLVEKYFKEGKMSFPGQSPAEE